MKSIRTLKSWMVVLTLTIGGIGCAKDVAESSSRSSSDLVAPAGQSGKPTAAVASFYTVAHYDEAGDPAADLAATIERATAERKRIILQVGGDWCSWCARITDYMQRNDRIRGLLEQSFLVMKVTHHGDHAAAFLESYPDIHAYPHFLVLDSDGEFLHSQGTGQLERDDSYDEPRFVEFLTNWLPNPAP